MVAYNICDRWDMAEDVVQEGFIKILNSQEVFINWRHGRKYLTGCIKNSAFERLNKENRIKAIRKDFIHHDPQHDCMKSISIGRQLAANISKIKCAMSRTIINEIYFYNRTRTEVAELYEISRNTVRNHEKEALDTLLRLYLTSNQ